MKHFSSPLRCIVFIATVLFFPPCAKAAKLKLPEWLGEASMRVTLTDKETVMQVLHNEHIVAVASNGRFTETRLFAARIVTRDGIPNAEVAIPYDASTEKITSFRAWIVRPSGEGKTYAKKDTADVALFREAVYAENRALCLSAEKDAVEDCIFAYEYTKEDKGIYGEMIWDFQSTHPVAFSRITVKLPKDWKVIGSMANHPGLEPRVKGAESTWEMRDLPPFKSEPLSPPSSRIYPRLNIQISPPEGMRNSPRVSYATWGEMSVFQTNLDEKSCQPDASVRAKATELLAAAGTGTWSRINALARYAQGINYVSINMNLGKGGGIMPRPAPEVLRTGYGDCKDKSALLRAMLKVACIESYSVAAYSGNRYNVDASWVTAMQFNHAITAIRIDDPAIQSPAIVDHPVFGRLLFFDPTNPYTPLGDLAYDAQGSLVLVLAGEKGELVRLPLSRPSDNHLERTISAEITAAGAIGARVQERSTGQTAAYLRSLYRAPSGKYADTIRGWINSSVRAAKIIKTEATDAQESGKFDLSAEFVAPGYAQRMRDTLLVFKPAILGRRNFIPLTQPERKYPVILEPQSFGETVSILIPQGFSVDELPRAVETTTNFGRYTAACEYDGAARTISYKRTLTINASEIPAAEYTKVRQFYETIRKAEQTPVVLKKS